VYLTKRQKRQNDSYRYWQNATTGKAPFVKVKTVPPYSAVDEQKVTINFKSFLLFKIDLFGSTCKGQI
jgi:hypothetical protein